MIFQPNHQSWCLSDLLTGGAKGGWLLLIGVSSLMVGIGEPLPTPKADSTVATLIAATKRGDLGQVQHLLGQGVNPDVHDNARNTALIFAARDGYLQIAQVLIAAGATVNWIDGEQVTPLILAAFKGHTSIVKLLLQHHADPAIRDQWERTALDYALRRGADHPISKLLFSAQKK